MIFIILMSFFFLKATNDWSTHVETAFEEARKSQKSVLLYFSGSDWCRPCIKLKKAVFNQNAFINFAKKELILVQLDFPVKNSDLDTKERRYREIQAEKYNPKGIFPFVLILDSSAKEKGHIAGYKSQSLETYLTKVKAIMNTKK